MTREEVADALAISPRTVARLVERHELPYVRLGRLARFRPSDVKALVRTSLHDERPASHGEPIVTTSTLAEQGHRGAEV